MNAVPCEVTSYAVKDYWDSRYENEKCYDWLSKYKDIEHIIARHVSPKDAILMLGCGNSELSADMYNDGFHHITNTDYSDVVIKNMKSLHEKEMPQMSWKVLDITDMTDMESGTYDVILEKGTIDALMVNQPDPWTVSEEMAETIDRVLSHVTRMLKMGGRFISISFRQPHFRRPLYARSAYDWNVQDCTIGESFHHYCYVATKGKTLACGDLKIEQERLTGERRLESTEIEYHMEDENENEILTKMTL